MFMAFNEVNNFLLRISAVSLSHKISLNKLSKQLTCKGFVMWNIESNCISYGIHAKKLNFKHFFPLKSESTLFGRGPHQRSFRKQKISKSLIYSGLYH